MSEPIIFESAQRRRWKREVRQIDSRVRDLRLELDDALQTDNVPRIREIEVETRGLALQKLAILERMQGQQRS